MREEILDFIRYCGPVASILLALMIILTIIAIFSVQLGLMIPAMIVGVIGLFTVKGY